MGKTPSSIPVKIIVVLTCMTKLLAFSVGFDAKIWAFFTDFHCFKATPAQQGKDLRVKENSEYI